MAASPAGLVYSDLVFLGYCAKRKFQWEGFVLASVSECMAKRAPDWVGRWDYNRATCWNSESEAWACVAEESRTEFAIFAYRLLPTLFHPSGDAEAVVPDELFPQELPSLPVDSVPSGYLSIGYDVVERHAAPGTLGFGCSPLSCNGMAKEIPVNRFCLLDDLETAITIARRFAKEQPEPGPYVIVKVLSPSSRI